MWVDSLAEAVEVGASEDVENGVLASDPGLDDSDPTDVVGVYDAASPQAPAGTGWEESKCAAHPRDLSDGSRSVHFDPDKFADGSTSAAGWVVPSGGRELLSYGSFTSAVSGPVSTQRLKFDLFWPQIGDVDVTPSEYVVMVHGGGGWKGCRDEVFEIARRVASTQNPADPSARRIAVIVPDYRLACVPPTSQTPDPLPPEPVTGKRRYPYDDAGEVRQWNEEMTRRLCGFPFKPGVSSGTDDLVNLVKQLQTTTDPTGSTLKAAITQLSGQPFTRKPYVVMGTSAGATLALQSLQGSYVQPGGDPSLFRGVVSVSGAGAKGYYWRNHQTALKSVCRPESGSVEFKACLVAATQVLGCRDVVNVPASLVAAAYPAWRDTPCPGLPPGSQAVSTWDATAPSWATPQTPTSPNMKFVFEIYGDGSAPTKKELPDDQSFDIRDALPFQGYDLRDCLAVTGTVTDTRIDNHGFPILTTNGARCKGSAQGMQVELATWMYRRLFT